MNILFLSQRLPEPPDKGDRIRSHHILKRLAARHAVHVGSLVDTPEDAASVRAARRWAASVTWRLRSPVESALRGAAALLAGRPMSAGYFRSSALAQALRELVRRQRFDVAVAYCSSMAGYLPRYQGAKVLDLVDVDSEKWRQYAQRSAFPRRLLYATEHHLLRAYERRLLEEFDRCVVVTSAERETLAAFADVSRLHVVENGVDYEFFRRSTPRPRRPEMVFVGALDYFANADGITHFAREIVPAVRARVPGATLRIVGRRPGPAVRSLGRLPGVEVVGEVADVRPALWRAAVAVVPLRIARGIQNKVLEAMAAGVPVVATPAALAGLSGRAGEHYQLARTREEFAEAIAALLERPETADELAERALLLVRREYSWDRRAKDYEAVLEAAAAARSPPPEREKG